MRRAHPLSEVDVYAVGWWWELRGIVRLARARMWRRAYERLRYSRRGWRLYRPYQAEIVPSECSCNAQRAWTRNGAQRAVLAAHHLRWRADLCTYAVGAIGEVDLEARDDGR